MTGEVIAVDAIAGDGVRATAPVVTVRSRAPSSDGVVVRLIHASVRSSASDPRMPEGYGAGGLGDRTTARVVVGAAVRAGAVRSRVHYYDSNN
ncbi:hypothetical protein GCM10027186_49080 [Micromonospora schwarzwaldensis]